MSNPIKNPEAELVAMDYEPKLAFARFRPWHVEINLNKAADLLDRCLADRAALNALRAQQALLDLSVLLDRHELEIDEDRVQSGYHDAKSALASEKATMLENTLANFGVIDPYLQRAHEASPGGSPGQWQTGAEVHKNAIYRDQLSNDRVIAKSDSITVAQEVGRAKTRTRLARNRLEQKVQLASAAGPLDYAFQARALLLRIQRDLSDATDRLVVASAGLRDIYGYPEDFPLLSIRSKGEDQFQLSRLDAAVVWVRDAIRWLAAFSQLDQSFVVSLSLKSLLGEKKFREVISGGTAFFSIPSKHLVKHRYMRLRGLSAQSVTSRPTGVLSIELTPPRRGRFVVLDERGNTKTLEVDQSTMPECVLGRVQDYRVAFVPDISGAISLMNASPMGDEASDDGRWRFSATLSGNLSAEDLEDVIVDFRLCGRPL